MVKSGDPMAAYCASGDPLACFTPVQASSATQLVLPAYGISRTRNLDGQEQAAQVLNGSQTGWPLSISEDLHLQRGIDILALGG